MTQRVVVTGGASGLGKARTGFWQRLRSKIEAAPDAKG